MNDIKITTKLVITIIIVSLFVLASFEFIYNNILYKGYVEMYERVDMLNDKIDLIYNYLTLIKR